MRMWVRIPEMPFTYGTCELRTRRETCVEVDPRYFRPTEVESLLGDAGKARRALGWVPQTSISELVEEMVTEDMKAAERDALIRQHGYRTYTCIEV